MIASLALTVLAFAQSTPQDESRSYDAFADDLAAEMGVPVAFVPAVASRTDSIAHLRVGTLGGPVVVLLPEDLTGEDALARAFGGGARNLCRSITSDEVLRQALNEAAILVPVDLGPDVVSAGSDVDPGKNFPARWEEARALAGSKAGPYPGAVPVVARLCDWLLTQRTCAAIVLAGDGAGAARNRHHAPGSLAAFCDERLGLGVARCDATVESRGIALRESVSGLPRLGLRDVRWQRLGATSWAADLELVNEGASATSSPLHERERRPRGVRLAGTVRSRGVLWSASAIAVDERGPLRVVDTEGGALALPDLAPGATLRVRLFFTGTPSGDAETPVIDLAATSPRALAASATRLSP